MGGGRPAGNEGERGRPGRWPAPAGTGEAGQVAAGAARLEQRVASVAVTRRMAVAVTRVTVRLGGRAAEGTRCGRAPGEGEVRDGCERGQLEKALDLLAALHAVVEVLAGEGRGE